MMCGQMPQVELQSNFVNSVKKEINMEEVFMTQEEFDQSTNIGDIIETDKGEKLRCISKENGVPQWEQV